MKKKVLQEDLQVKGKSWVKGLRIPMVSRSHLINHGKKYKMWEVLQGSEITESQNSLGRK